MSDLRGAPSVFINFLPGTGGVIPVNFGQSFNVGRNMVWDYVGGIGNVMAIEPVLNFVSATFSQGRATVFTGLLVEQGMIAEKDIQYFQYVEDASEAWDIIRRSLPGAG